MALLVAFAFSASSPVCAAVHAGDKLDVVVFDHPDISKSGLIVSNQGTIDVPLAGRIRVQGLEPQAIAREIESNLTSFIYAPAVDVAVTSESTSAYITGATTQTIALHANQTLAMAVRAATLPTTADLTRVSILSDGGGTSRAYDIPQIAAGIDTTPRLVAGDIINIPTKPIDVSVLGAVKAPFTTYLSSSEPRSAALANLQLADDANTARVIVMTGDKVYNVPRGDSLLAQPALAGDRLVIPTSISVTVLGLAAKPGAVTLKGDTTLATALTLAGGPGKGADLGRIAIVSPTAPAGQQQRTVDYNAFTRGQANGNPELADGDFIYVPKAHVLLTPQQILALVILLAAKVKPKK